MRWSLQHVLTNTISSFSLHNSMTAFSVSKVAVVGQEVPDLFVAVFNGEWGEGMEGEGKEAWLDFQLDTLHMMGALFSSSKVGSPLKPLPDSSPTPMYATRTTVSWRPRRRCVSCC